METLKPTLKRGRDVWDPINMPAVEFRARVETLREVMGQKGLDLLLIYGYGPDAYGDQCYISNFLIKMPRGALVAIPTEGEVSLFVEGFPRDQPFVQCTTWIRDIRTCRDVAESCRAYIQEQPVRPEAIGLAGLREHMPYGQFRLLTQGPSPANFIACDNILSGMRALKSIREQDQVRRAARIVERTFSFLTTAPWPENNESIIEAGLDYFARLEGAEDVRVLVARQNGTDGALRLARDVSLAAGDGMIVYLAVALERYWSEGIRTLVATHGGLAPAPDEAVRELYMRIVNRMLPQKSIASFQAEVRDEIENSPFAHPGRYDLGQGIGLSLSEAPALAGEADGCFQAGHCLALRLDLKDQKGSRFVSGDTLLVTSAGGQVLTTR